MKVQPTGTNLASKFEAEAVHILSTDWLTDLPSTCRLSDKTKYFLNILIFKGLTNIIPSLMKNYSACLVYF